MMPLAREFRLDDADGVYAALVAAHKNLDATASAALNTRLVLLLANHIGDADVVREAISRAATAAPEPRRQ